MVIMMASVIVRNDLSKIHCFNWNKTVILSTLSPQQQEQQLLVDIDMWRHNR